MSRPALSQIIVMGITTLLEVYPVRAAASMVGSAVHLLSSPRPRLPWRLIHWTVLVFCIWRAILVEGSPDPGITRAESAMLIKPVVGSVVA
jgi:hypothetical protein